MNERIAALLTRARTEISAARTLSAAGFAPQSTSRAYYAAFYAAEAALMSIGESRSKHAGVLSAFGRLVVKDGGFDPDVGRVVRRLFERRNAADYAWIDAEDVSGEDETAAAESFVDAVEAWIASRP
jgi:uncharacterized protein (UPF0332 family)